MTPHFSATKKKRRRHSTSRAGSRNQARQNWAINLPEFLQKFERGGGDFTNAVHSAGATARHARRAQAGGKDKLKVEKKKKKKKQTKKNKKKSVFYPTESTLLGLFHPNDCACHCKRPENDRF
jgi:hypothetical protein